MVQRRGQPGRLALSCLAVVNPECARSGNDFDDRLEGSVEGCPERHHLVHALPGAPLEISGDDQAAHGVPHQADRRVLGVVAVIPIVRHQKGRIAASSCSLAPVIFGAHKNTADGLEATRRLFKTLNIRRAAGRVRARRVDNPYRPRRESVGARTRVCRICRRRYDAADKRRSHAAAAPPARGRPARTRASPPGSADRKRPRWRRIQGAMRSSESPQPAAVSIAPPPSARTHTSPVPCQVASPVRRRRSRRR